MREEREGRKIPLSRAGLLAALVMVLCLLWPGGIRAKAATYNPWSAAAYANCWAWTRNPRYYNYRNADCANFVSQALSYGGMPRTSTWRPYTLAWVNANAHRRYFSQRGRLIVNPRASQVRVGDPVYYDWNYDGIYDHMAICVGSYHGVPVVDAHSNNHYHASWTLNRRARRAVVRLNYSFNGSSYSSYSTSTRTYTTPTYSSGRTSTRRAGWVGTKYRMSNGRYARNRLLTIGGYKYYFNAYGNRVIGWRYVGRHLYYFRRDGRPGAAWIGWLRYAGRWHYFWPYGNYMARSSWVGGYWINAAGYAPAKRW